VACFLDSQCTCLGDEAVVGQCYNYSHCPVDDTSRHVTSMSLCCCPQQGQRQGQGQGRGWRDNGQCRACPSPSSGERFDVHLIVADAAAAAADDDDDEYDDDVCLCR